eukprot:CAMPEP_0119310612 /NCGR_PEP_ID=MMETSP1333-20130426/19670_1 /TAXON_ID=418940 /ORGANISM="Scyphosphaera apsteinii, Strain RCC1455" /LENGTH=94 /DNA_ID=CAMNT_0007314827 /DNA_START=170 /DNA_END=454 /DNA_ORIENTATION=-
MRPRQNTPEEDPEKANGNKSNKLSNVTKKLPAGLPPKLPSMNGGQHVANPRSVPAGLPPKRPPTCRPFHSEEAVLAYVTKKKDIIRKAPATIVE